MIIKHFLILEQNKRLGCTKIADIVDEPFCNDFDWKGLLLKNKEAPFIPQINGNMDTTNYKKIEDKNENDEENIEIDKERDSFYNW